MIISEPQLIGALETLQNIPARLANATYQATRAERMLKHTKALAMKAVNDRPVSAQERDAYASQSYIQGLEEEAKAAADLALVKAEMEAAKLIIDVWRTEESSARAATR